MDTTLNLKVFILMLIERHNSLDYQYSLTKFFAKSAVLPDKLYQTLNSLEYEGFIQIKDIHNTVKYYTISDKGVQFIETNFSRDILEIFLHEIEESDFYISLLSKLGK